MDYSKTLNLPQTDFSMRAGLVTKEPAFLEQWHKNALYTRIRKQSQGKPPFILHDGPPYANGNIHIGHALNKILKDVIVRQKTMAGFDSLFIPGWDCHGLPIEHQLLKEMKARKSDVECLPFRKKAHDYAMKYVGIQREQFQRLGIFAQWDNPYLTLTPGYEYWILRSLAELTEKGYVYRRLKPVNWCYQCETALAEAEVEYEDHTSPTAFVKFRVQNPGIISAPQDKPVSLLIWTTTPWTLLANVAVAVQGEFDYVLIEVNDEVLIIEKTLSVSVLTKAGINDGKVIGEIKGTGLTALTYAHPFGKKTNCSVVAVDYVTHEDGTGLVHTAPGHGQDDYETGLKYKLDIIMPVNHKGVFTDDGAPYAGEHVFKANPKVIADLRARGDLFYTEDVQHSYPHCWRCKNAIIFRATEQWFLKIDHNGLRDQLQTAVKKDVTWFPAAGQERIEAMVRTRPDWCLSRQRYWGVPIPAVSCLDCNEQFLVPAVIYHVADLVRESGSDIWFEKDLSELLPDGFTCPSCRGSNLKKSSDILDVWFDSGVSHRAVFHEMLKMPLPADLYLEGSDQHRGWFQSSLIPSVALTGKAPYRQVLTHGFVVDGQGRKMSKSLGNVVSPEDIIKNNGADILRLWVASSNYHDDIRVSKEILERLVDAYRKIRNTFRYLLGNVAGFDPMTEEVPYTQLSEIDQWALNRLARTITSVTQAYEVYDFAKVYKTVYTFCNEDCSSIYLDILKDRLYTSAALSPERKSAQTVLYHILSSLTGLLAPVLTFTAEEVYQAMPKADIQAAPDSIHLCPWPVARPEWLSSDVEERFKRLMQIRPFVLKSLDEKRREGLIGGALEAKVIFETSSPRDREYLESLHDFLATALIVSQVEIRAVEKAAAGLGEMFPQTAVAVEKADGQKCGRCWKYREDVGQHQNHETLCGACVEVVQSVQNVSQL